jgi:hypothetical protein
LENRILAELSFGAKMTYRLIDQEVGSDLSFFNEPAEILIGIFKLEKV